MARKFEPKALVLDNPQRIERKQALAESVPQFMVTGHELCLNIRRHDRAGTPIPPHVIRNVIEANIKRAIHSGRKAVGK